MSFLVEEEVLTPLCAEIDSLMESPQVLMEELSMSHPKDIGFLPIGIRSMEKASNSRLQTRPVLMAKHATIPGTFTGIMSKPVVDNKLAAIALTCAATVFGFIHGLSMSARGEHMYYSRPIGGEREARVVEDLLLKFSMVYHTIMASGVGIAGAREARATLAYLQREHLAPALTDVLWGVHSHPQRSMMWMELLLLWYLLVRYIRLAAEAKFSGFLGKISWHYSLRTGLTKSQQALVQLAFNVSERLSVAPRHDVPENGYEQTISGTIGWFPTVKESSELTSAAPTTLCVVAAHYPFAPSEMNKWTPIVLTSRPMAVIREMVTLSRYFPDVPDLEKVQADWYLVNSKSTYKESDLPPLFADSRALAQTITRMVPSIYTEVHASPPVIMRGSEAVCPATSAMFDTLLFMGVPLFGGDSVIRNVLLPQSVLPIQTAVDWGSVQPDKSLEHLQGRAVNGRIGVSPAPRRPGKGEAPIIIDPPEQPRTDAEGDRV
jgi:hypothetical protein